MTQWYTNQISNKLLENLIIHIDGGHRLDLRYTVSALEVGYPRGVGLRFSTRITRLADLIRSPPNGRPCRDRRGVCDLTFSMRQYGR